MKLLITVNDEAIRLGLLAKLREHGVPATSVDHEAWGVAGEAAIYVLCPEDFERAVTLVYGEGASRPRMRDPAEPGTATRPRRADHGDHDPRVRDVAMSRC